MFGQSLQLGWRTLWVVLRWNWGHCRAPPALAAVPMRYSVSITVQHLKSCRTYGSVRYPLSIRRLFHATTGSPSHPNRIILYSTDALFFQAALISLRGMERVAVYSILAFPDLSPFSAVLIQLHTTVFAPPVPSMTVYALFFMRPYFPLCG